MPEVVVKNNNTSLAIELEYKVVTSSPSEVVLPGIIYMAKFTIKISFGQWLNLKNIPKIGLRPCQKNPREIRRGEMKRGTEMKQPMVIRIPNVAGMSDVRVKPTLAIVVTLDVEHVRITVRAGYV